MALSKAKLDSRKKRLEKKFRPDFEIKDWRESNDKKKKKESEEYSERPEWEWLKK